MPKFRNLATQSDISTAKSDSAPTRAEMVERIARHLHDLLLLDYPKEPSWVSVSPGARCRYLAVAERMLENPPPGFKRT